MPTATPRHTRRAVLGAALAAPLLARAGAAAPGAAASFQADADLLARAYTALHPGLFRYNTPAQMAARFDGLRADFAEPRTLAQAYVALARVTAAVRCGHSHPNFYNQSKAVCAVLFDGQDRLPLLFRWIDGRMVVTRDLSPAGGLLPGTEILSFNGLPAQRLLQGLLPLARADGSNDGKRQRLLDVTGLDRWEAFDLYLPMLWPQAVASGEATLDTLAPDGSRRRVTLALMTAAQRRAAAPSGIDQPRDAVLWTLSQRPGGTSLLQMPTWSVYNGSWNWRGWLDDALDTVAHDGTQTLVVDLRGNEGGLDCGNAILARLIDRDLALASNARRVRYRQLPADLAPHVDTWDDSFRDWGQDAVGPRDDGFYTLTRWADDASGNSVIRPAGRRFRGRLLVLVDAANSSATFQFAQAVQDHGLGRLVGSTTGGNRRGINGGAFLFLRLPASGIEVDIPLVGYFPAGAQPDAGLVPDVLVQDSIADVASGLDRTLATTLGLAA